MAREDTRLKVRHSTEGWVGAVEKTFGKYCSVQLSSHSFYRVCPVDDLEPIEEAEFRRRFR